MPNSRRVTLLDSSSREGASDYLKSILDPTTGALYLLDETTDDPAKNSLYTGGLGPELWVNGDFSAWSGDDPDGWTVTESPPDSEVRESVAGGQAELENVATLSRIRQNISTIGDTYRVGMNIISISAGVLGNVSNTNLLLYTTPGIKLGDLIAAGNQVDIRKLDAGIAIVDDATARKSGELDGLNVGCTIDQPGIDNRAYLLDGVDDNIKVVDASGILDARTTRRWAFLVKATSLGENDLGTLFCWGTWGSAHHLLSFDDTNRLRAYVGCATTPANAISDDNEISDIIGNWAWIFMDYDDAGTRKIRLWKAIDGIVTQLSLGTDQAGVGAVTAQTDDLFFGNSSGLSTTLAGLMELIGTDGNLWTQAEMERCLQLLPCYTTSHAFTIGFSTGFRS